MPHAVADADADAVADEDDDDDDDSGAAEREAKLRAGGGGEKAAEEHENGGQSNSADGAEWRRMCARAHSPRAASVPRPSVGQVRPAIVAATREAGGLLDLRFGALLAARVGCIGPSLGGSSGPCPLLVSRDGHTSFAADNLPSGHRLGRLVRRAAPAAAHRRVANLSICCRNVRGTDERHARYGQLEGALREGKRQGALFIPRRTSEERPKSTTTTSRGPKRAPPLFTQKQAPRRSAPVEVLPLQPLAACHP